MLVKVLSGTTIGLDGVLIEVEVDVAERGFPTFTIVGLPDRAVDEAKHRVRSAILHAGFEMPDSRITVNLAPANIPKIGSVFDLPIAVAILAASGVLRTDGLNDSFFIGELSLDGKVRRVSGAISLADLAKRTEKNNIFLPVSSSYEASLIDGVDIFPILYLSDLILHLNKVKEIQKFKSSGYIFKRSSSEIGVDFADIKGQELAKRALTIAAAGFHNIQILETQNYHDLSLKS